MRARYRFLALLTTLLMFALTLVGCHEGSESHDGGTPTEKKAEIPAAPKPAGTVRIGLLKVPQWLPVYEIGQHLPPEVKVEYSELQATQDTLLALRAGNFDMAVLGYPQLLKTLDAEDLPFTVVAGVSSGATRIVVPAKSAINDWADLKGKQIVVMRGSIHYFQFVIAAQKHGLNPKDLEFVNVAGAQEMAMALERGDADAYVAWDPPAALSVVKGAGKTPEAFASEKLYAETFKVANGLVIRSDFLAKNRELVLEVLKAYVKATDRVLGDREGTIERAAKLTGVGAPVLKQTFTNAFPEYVIREQEVLALARAMKESGITREDRGAQLVGKFDYTLLEQATGKPRDQLQGK